MHMAVDGEPLGDGHYPAGRALREADAASQPATAPSSSYEFPTHPTRCLDQFLFKADVALDEELFALQHGAVDVKVYAERFRSQGGVEDLGVMERMAAAVWVVWSWLPFGSHEKLRTVIDHVFGSSYERRAPFPNALAAFAFACSGRGTIGMGAGRNLSIAEDSAAARKVRARMKRDGRALPRNPDGTRAVGWLPPEWMPAKQSRNGCTGGAVGEERVFLRTMVDKVIGRAKIEPIDLVILRRLRVEGAKAAALAEELHDWADLDLSDEAVGKRASRALHALAEAFQARGLIPPMQGVRPRRTAAAAREPAPSLGATQAPKVAS